MRLRWGLQVLLFVGGPAHLTGTCTCCGGTDDPDLGLSRREAGLAVWLWLQLNGTVQP